MPTDADSGVDGGLKQGVLPGQLPGRTIEQQRSAWAGGEKRLSTVRKMTRRVGGEAPPSMGGAGEHSDREPWPSLAFAMMVYTQSAVVDERRRERTTRRQHDAQVAAGVRRVRRRGKNATVRGRKLWHTGGSGEVRAGGLFKLDRRARVHDGARGCCRGLRHIWSFAQRGRGTTATAPASSTPGTVWMSWWLRKTTARSGAGQPRGS